MTGMELPWTTIHHKEKKKVLFLIDSHNTLKMITLYHCHRWRSIIKNALHIHGSDR